MNYKEGNQEELFFKGDYLEAEKEIGKGEHLLCLDVRSNYM